MPNMNPKKNPMPTLAPDIRATCFEEVAQGYGEEVAKEEAARCLHCKHRPCVSGCPVGVAIPDFLAEVAEGNFEEAYKIITRTNALPAVCGRVCPQENQCEHNCVRGIKGESVGIGRLERFVADWHRTHTPQGTPAKPKEGARRVAIVGSGPSGLSCAGELAARGYAVTVFEALHTPGGVLMYGIPEFRLPKDIVRAEIDALRAAGVEIVCNTVVGRTVTLEELLGEEGFEAVFIGSGAGLPRFMNIPGEHLKGVCSANEYLTRINLMGAWKSGGDTPVMHPRRVAVVGGGNVAMDAARCARRMGADEVHIVYRRSEAELPARAEEVAHAKEEGIIFDLLTNPVRILGDEDGNVRALEVVTMALGEPDASGRRRPVEVEGSAHELPMDAVIMAIGTSPNPLLRQITPGLVTESHGCIVTDPGTGATSIPGVYAGGDAVTGAATVILAMGAGKTAAQAIDAYLCSRK